MIRETRREPLGGIEDGEMGRYVIVDVDDQDPAPAQREQVFDHEDYQPQDGQSDFEDRPPVDVNVKVKQTGALRKVIALGATAAVLTGVGAKFAYDFLTVPRILPPATHDLEVGVTNVDSFVVHDKTINFIDVTSTFDYYQYTSLDRPGPFNCDGEIDKRMEADSRGNITLKTASIEITDNEKAKITVSGEIESETFLDISKNNIVPAMVAGGLDYCKIGKAGVFNEDGSERPDKDLDEQDWAEKIALINTRNAAEVAYACAAQQEGEVALESAIKDQAIIFSEKLAAIDPEDIEVEFEDDFDEHAKAEIDKVVAKFYRDFEDIADRYIKVTEDENGKQKKSGSHKAPMIDARQLTDCSEHDISVREK